MQHHTAHVPMPQITVDEAGTARSVAFDDVYFSARGGIAETEHVFLAGNDLPARWRTREDFTIGELGFGTGLNFLVAWKRFVETNTTGTLHFVSVEKFPLTAEQLQHALAHQPELAAYAAQLVAQYPLRLPGLHRVNFDRVRLTLAFGDVAEQLPDMQAQVDAWFLDGFAPARNSAMWSSEVFQQIARLSAPGATFATFTAAGAVKRGLQAAGFTVSKVQGFAYKREMLVGRYEAPSSCDGLQDHKITKRSAVIIGGGIAGCSAARALAERGWQVTLHDQATIASGASGNPAAVLYPQLTKYYTPATAWHFAAYDFALRALARWGATLHRTGMLKIGHDAESDARMRSIRDVLQLDKSVAQWLEPEQATAHAGQALAYGGFYFPHGVWIRPAEVCRALLNHPAITVREHSAMTGLPEADAVIIANAQAANDLLPKPLSMGVTAGQVSVLEPGLKLDTVLCHKGYAIDASDALIIGATYDRADLSGAVTDANHQHNIQELQAALGTHPARVTGGRSSLRATTPNRLPHVGRVKDGVYVSGGHGSRGMISAPLAAELIASEICGEPLPVSRALRAALAPR